jgi:hypothetical protein
VVLTFWLRKRGEKQKEAKEAKGTYARRKRGQLRAGRPLKEEASLFSLERKWIVVLRVWSSGDLEKGIASEQPLGGG